MRKSTHGAPRFPGLAGLGLLGALAVALVGCDRKEPGTNGPLADPARSQATPSATTGDPAIGDPLGTVYAKWGKPEVIKLEIDENAFILKFEELPPSYNPQARLTLYYVSRNKSLRFHNGEKKTVESIGPIDESERSMVEQTAAAKRDPVTTPAGGAP